MSCFSPACVHGRECRVGGDVQPDHPFFPHVSEMHEFAWSSLCCEGDDAPVREVDVTRALTGLEQTGADQQVDMLGSRFESAAFDRRQAMKEAIDRNVLVKCGWLQ